MAKKSAVTVGPGVIGPVVTEANKSKVADSPEVVR